MLGYIDRPAPGGSSQWAEATGHPAAPRSNSTPAEPRSTERMLLPAGAAVDTGAVGKGAPDDGFAFPWSVYEWVDGEPAGIDAIGDPTEFADNLAAFLIALRRIDSTGGPEPGLHNWFRGGPL